MRQAFAFLPLALLLLAGCSEKPLQNQNVQFYNSSMQTQAIHFEILGADGTPAFAKNITVEPLKPDQPTPTISIPHLEIGDYRLRASAGRESTSVDEHLDRSISAIIVNILAGGNLDISVQRGD
ncbi:MAG: hypothetical protein ABR562_01745 [Thermoplasmatota archaeon]